MNERMMKGLPLFLSLLFALLVGGCGATAGDPPLKGATMGGPFELTSHEGKRVSDRDFEGSYRLIYFGYSYCPDVCPVDLQTISAGLTAFEQSDPRRAARVQPIFITVDPKRDTPEALARYAEAFHPRLVALTGTEEEIKQTARTFAVNFQLHPPATPGGEYLVDHSRIAILYGPEGEPVAIVPHDQGPQGVASELDKWVN
jgi:protein SCO1/2